MDLLQGEEYSFYWETKMFLEAEELERSLGLEFDAAVPGLLEYYSSAVADSAATASSTVSQSAALGSGSRDGEGSSASSSTASKNVLVERNRRKRLNDKLFALRSVVPNISKMDKMSIVKDAIDHILELQEEERKILAEMEETAADGPESSSAPPLCKNEYGGRENPTRRKRRRTVPRGEATGPSFEDMELQVSAVGMETSLVIMTCAKKEGTMARVCAVFGSLELNIVSANVATLSGRIRHTLLVQRDGMQPAQLKQKIELAIAELDAP